MLIQMVSINVKPGHAAEFLEAFRINYEGTRQEPGFLDPNAPIGPRFAASGSTLGGLPVGETLARLGFFDAPPDFRGAPELNIRQLPTINAPTAQAASFASVKPISRPICSCWYTS